MVATNRKTLDGRRAALAPQPIRVSNRWAVHALTTPKKHNR